MTQPVDRSVHVGKRCSLRVHPLITTLTKHPSTKTSLFLTVTIKLDNKMDPEIDKYYEILKHKHGAWQQLSTRFRVVPSKQYKDMLVTIDPVLPMQSFS